MINRLRLSYTLVSIWNSNDLDNLINYYFRTGETKMYKGMQLGKDYDELNRKSILKHNRLIPEFGGDVLKSPIPALKLSAIYDDTIEYVGEMDTYDEGTLYEYKVGSFQDSTDYARTEQLPFYYSLLKAHGLPVERGIVIHYDPTTKSQDRTLLYCNEEMLQRFNQIVETKGKDIYQYFVTNGLL